MSLLRLPSEILADILDHVGSAYFQEDVGRLAICKEWFVYAQSVCYKDVRLSQRTLRRLLASARSVLLMKNSVEVLSLELTGFDDWRSLREPGGDRRTVQAWEMGMDNDLARLAFAARESRRLRRVSIQAVDGCLSLRTMRALLSAENLAVLELDLNDGFRENDAHICARIGTLLGTLRRFWLRMRSICPDALRVQSCDNLEEVLVNLALYKEAATSVTHSTRCNVPEQGILRLKADMQDEAEVLAGKMASPKTVRILMFPHMEIESWDALTGKRMTLSEDMAWEDDGSTVEEAPSSDSGISDDGFAASFDG